MNVRTKRQALIEIASQFIGVAESGGDNRGPQIERFQKSVGSAKGEPWCVSFVQFCVRECDRYWAANHLQQGASGTLLFPTASSRTLWEKTPKVARTEEPEMGDLAIWAYVNDAGSQTNLGHCGLVMQLLSDGHILTVEGNTSPYASAEAGKDREGDGVFVRRRNVSQTKGSLQLLGFLMPWAY